MRAIWVTNSRSSEFTVVDSEGHTIPNVIVVIPEVDEQSVKTLRLLGFDTEAHMMEAELNERKEDKAWTK